MRRVLLALSLALVFVVPSRGDSFGPPPLVPMFAQTTPGSYITGAGAAGAEVSLLGTTRDAAGQPNAPVISCPQQYATWEIEGGGIFSTAAVPGNITPKITFGTGSVSKTISNLLASASDAEWSGRVTLRCETIGTSGTMRAYHAEVTYETGQIYFGTAPLNNGGAVITLDNTGAMPIDIKVLMATQSASNKFRLDGLTVRRVY